MGVDSASSRRCVALFALILLQRGAVSNCICKPVNVRAAQARALRANHLRGGSGSGDDAPMEWEGEGAQNKVGEEHGQGLQRSIELMEHEMQKAVHQMKFEEAARLRDAIAILKQGVGVEGSKPKGSARQQESAGSLTFDWERLRGEPPITQTPKEARPPSAAVQDVPAPTDVGIWPESDAGVDSTVTTVSREDKAMAQTLEQARRAMQQVSTDGELDIQLIIKRFDQALDSLVADARTSSPDSLLACLRALVQALASISQSPLSVQGSVDLGGGPFCEAGPKTLDLLRGALQVLGFVGSPDKATILSLPENLPLYILREAQASLGVTISHLEPTRTSTPQQAPIQLALTERDVAVLVPSNAPLQLPEVPEEVYNFTARDLIDVLESTRSEYAAASTLMTRGMRQRRQLAHKAAETARCRVRIRLSDGAMVEATFGADEGVAAILSVLSHVFADGSAEPILTTMPPVRVLAGPTAVHDEVSVETMSSLGLVPAGVLNCRGAGGIRLEREAIREGVAQRPLVSSMGV